MCNPKYVVYLLDLKLDGWTHRPCRRGRAGLQNAGFEGSTRLTALYDLVSLLHIRRRYLTCLWSFEIFLKLGLLRTIEMKTIRAIHRKTLRDKIRSDQLRQLSGIQDIIKWTNVRRKEWDAHVERMEDNRLAKMARDNRPQGLRSRGRPKKRWKESLNAAPSP